MNSKSNTLGYTGKATQIFLVICITPNGALNFGSTQWGLNLSRFAFTISLKKRCCDCVVTSTSGATFFTRNERKLKSMLKVISVR